MALDSTEDIGGSADKEEEEFVVTDVVDSAMDVGKEKVDYVECGLGVEEERDFMI